MSDKFDAGKEAEYMEQLARERLDESNPDKGKDISRKLCEEWLALSQSERNAVASQLEERFANRFPNKDPLPDIYINYQNGDAWGVRFTPSFLDSRQQDHDIEIVSPSGPETVGRATFVGMKDAQVDYEVRNGVEYKDGKPVEKK